MAGGGGAAHGEVRGQGGHRQQQGDPHRWVLSLCRGRLCNICTGGFTPFPGEYYASIHRFDPATLAWLEVGAMRQPRSFHGLSVVMAEDIRDYCR